MAMAFSYHVYPSFLYQIINIKEKSDFELEL